MLTYIKSEKCGRKYFIYKLVQSIFEALFPIILITMPGLLINTLTQESADIRMCIVYLCIILILPIFSYFLNLLFNYKLKQIKQIIDLEIDIKFYHHVLRMDYETFDDPKIQIDKGRSHAALSKIWEVSDILFGFITQIISLVTVILVISFLNPLLIIVILVFSILLAVIKKTINKKLFELDQQGSAIDRRMWGIAYMLDQKDYAKEIRLFDISDLLLNEYKKIKNDSLNLNMEYYKNQNIPGNCGKIFELIQNACIYIYLIYNVVANSMLIGDFTIYLSYYSRFTGMLNGLLNSFLQLSRINLNVGELNQFMNLPMNLRNSGHLHIDYSKKSVIEFKNVSFKYPGGEIYALEDINITLSFNEKLCIVGENGSGKSTFIKLLTRLYAPTEGTILLNNRNISEYDYDEYLKLFSPVFQDFVRYYLSVGLNIALTSNYDVNKLNGIIKQCHLETLIQKLSKGYSTQVGKWIDPEGIEPSGGENQRIAIARALYHGGEIFILDEPTAALDPNAEYEIYKQFNSMIKDKTAVLVTHRLSAVQLADQVAVFNAGHIVDCGTHKELYAKGGIYTEMFDKQAQFYRDEPKSETQSDT